MADAKQSQKRRQRKNRNKSEQEDLLVLISPEQSQANHEIVQQQQAEFSELSVESPRNRGTAKNQATSAATPAKTQEVISQTPRRSARKSIKPAQDYDEIIVKRGVLSRTKQNINETLENHDDAEEKAPKWTPAKVGRVSQKRARKTKSTKGKRQINTSKIENSDKENVSSQEEETAAEAAIIEIGDEISLEKVETVAKDIAEAAPIEIVDEVFVEKAETIVEYIAETSPEAAPIEIVDEISVEKLETIAETSPETATIEIVDEICVEKPETDAENTTKINQKGSAKKNSFVEVQPADEEMFGFHLKSKALNVEDLGLQQLSDEQSSDEAVETEELPEKKPEQIQDENCLENKNNTFNAAEEEKLEVQTSIAAAGDKANVNETFKANDEDKENILNDTFNASDCIILEESLKNDGEDSDCHMESLQLSDDDEIEEVPQQKASPKATVPKLVLTDAEGCNKTMQMTPCAAVVDASKKKPVSFKCTTPEIKSTTSRKIDSKIKQQQDTSVCTTPKIQSAKRYRFPTPYKVPKNFKFNDAENVNAAAEEKPKSILTNSLITMPPKEMILRSVRKRSLSVCITGRDTAKKVREISRVTFHSPANQTAVIEEFDKLIATTIKKTQQLLNTENNANITKRRPRSASFDETLMGSNKKALIRSGKKAQNARETPQKVKPVRTKMLNFAAIHQKQFDKMENLVEHVARKVERAKILTNSSTKKPKDPLKLNASTATAVASDKNNAVAKKNLTSIMSKSMLPVRTITRQTTKRVATVNSIKDFKPLTAKELGDELNSMMDLALEKNPNLVQIPTARVEPMITKTTTTKASTAAATTTAITKINKKPILIQKQQTENLSAKKMQKSPAQKRQILSRPAFNLSTALLATKPLTTTTTTKPTNLAVLNVTATAATATTKRTMENKVASRKERHMEMFKGRIGSTRTEKHREILRGVRSNRRFELQMQHRQNMEHN